MDHQALILNHLEHLAFERDPFLSSGHYFFVRNYIAQELANYGEVTFQRSQSSRQEILNIILSLPASSPHKRPIIIGAHYDSVPGTPGADDNASGVAVLLALAKTLSQSQLKTPVRLIAFDLEEYGFLGSQAYVDSLRSQNEKVKLMISLEMLGYISHEPNSQDYPPGLARFYPDQGNFIALVGNLKSIPQMMRLRRILQQNHAPCEWLPAPFRGTPIPVTRLSDHVPFWDYGSPAMMMSDTAFLRNPHYHQPSDTIDTLNLPFMAHLLKGLTQAIEAIAS